MQMIGLTDSFFENINITRNLIIVNEISNVAITTWLNRYI